MRILQINSVVNYGSTGHIVEDIGKQIKNENIESFIFYGRNKRTSESISYYFANKISLCLHLFSSFVLGIHGYGILGSYFTTKKMIKEIQKIKPDLIHIHNIHGYFLNYKMLFAYLKTIDIPIVWTLHDCWSYTGHCAYYSAVNCNKWKNQCRHCSQRKTYPTSLFFDNSKKDYLIKQKSLLGVKNMTLVTPSRWLSNELNNSFLSCYRKNVIPNGIDLSIFRPVETDDLFPGKFVILGVANVWSVRKGLKDFIELSKKLDDEIIVLIGVDKKQKKELPKNIIGIERTESQYQLVKYYSRANVYFNPSIEETQGLTTIEALACGTPVIVYDKTAVPECVDKSIGCIIKAGEINDVHKYINEMKNNTIENIINQRKICREYSMIYDKNLSAKKYVNLYKNLLGGVK
ncbi:MAG: glycosyltransferase [Treponema sp.]|nr:glycosyltransferase [Treponema sp.]